MQADVLKLSADGLRPTRSPKSIATLKMPGTPEHESHWLVTRQISLRENIIRRKYVTTQQFNNSSELNRAGLVVNLGVNLGIKPWRY